jgi:hypothetical protein
MRNGSNRARRYGADLPTVETLGADIHRMDVGCRAKGSGHPRRGGTERSNPASSANESFSQSVSRVSANIFLVGVASMLSNPRSLSKERIPSRGRGRIGGVERGTLEKRYPFCGTNGTSLPPSAGEPCHLAVPVLSRSNVGRGGLRWPIIRSYGRCPYRRRHVRIQGSV